MNESEKENIDWKKESLPSKMIEIDIAEYLEHLRAMIGEHSNVDRVVK